MTVCVKQRSLAVTSADAGSVPPTVSNPYSIKEEDVVVDVNVVVLLLSPPLFFTFTSARISTVQVLW